MTKILLVLLILSGLNCRSQNENTAKDVNVLFIGNSLSYYHDMPQTVQKMVDETHPTIKIEQITFPGMSITDHLSNIVTSKTENGIATRIKVEGEKTETEIKIAEKKWDVIILQTGTVSVLIPENRIQKVGKAIAEIKKLVTNPNCKFILFQTWPSKKNYPEQYCYPSFMIDPLLKKDECCSPILESLEQEFALIKACYNLVATENNLIESSNGSKFFEVLQNYPEIELYEDESHPNANGAFLNACIFYQMLTNESAISVKHTGTINPITAEKLKKIAK